MQDAARGSGTARAISCQRGGGSCNGSSFETASRSADRRKSVFLSPLQRPEQEEEDGAKFGRIFLGSGDRHRYSRLWPCLGCLGLPALPCSRRALQEDFARRVDRWPRRFGTFDGGFAKGRGEQGFHRPCASTARC